MAGDVPQQIKARRGFSIFYRGKTLLSNIDPVAQAERLADNVPMQERTLYVCLSPLYGYGLRRLLDRMAQAAPNSAVLCIEADEQLFRIAAESIPAELTADGRPHDGRLHDDCLQSVNLREKSAVCEFARQHWGKRRFRRVKKVCFSGGWQLFPELYDSLIDALQREIAVDWSNALVLAKLGRLYIRNALRNLALLSRYPSITRLSFNNAPVLALGAGPSLNGALDSLERHFGKSMDKASRCFRIICADTCLRALYARNIEPDLVVILESQHWNLDDFTGLGGWRIPAAFDLSALPASSRLANIQPYLFFTPWTELRLFERLDTAALLPAIFPPLGSVGLSAVAIALRVTSGPVLIAGMDFSFTIDSSHARSCPGHLNRLARHNRLSGLHNAAAFIGSQKLIGKSGAPVLSNPALRNYRDMFEQEFASNARLFDTGGSGLALGIPILQEAEYVSLLEQGGTPSPLCAQNGETQNIAVHQQLIDFIQAETERLITLKNILAGTAGEQPQTENTLAKLETLIDECDYLWAHFPDYAETGGRRPSSAELAAASPQAISFLKRLRTEIGSVVKIFETGKG